MDSNLISQIKFNIAYIKLSTKTEGPYNRCCIWFQGCNIHCSGCCNKELQALTPKNIVSLDQLLSIIKEAKEKYNIEGVTLSGGEPTLQVGLSKLNTEIHNFGLGIILFSGKLKEQINSELINSIDLLIDGPYVESKKDTKRVLIGSINKNITFITNRYKQEAEYFNNLNSIEEVTAEEYIFINGD